jgi:hypothetical protein
MRWRDRDFGRSSCGEVTTRAPKSHDRTRNCFARRGPERDQGMWSLDRQGVVASLHCAPRLQSHEFESTIQSIVR